MVVVAHNAPFEDAFLTAEFARSGCSPPPMPALDTLPLAQWCVPTPNHRLATVCQWAGVSIHGAHTAMGDARATAQMLPRAPSAANYKITRELLATKAKSDAILLHSLPRMDEIPPDVDITRWSRYWQEAFNGVVMRMALLALVLGA